MDYSSLTDKELYDINMNNLTKTDLKDLMKEKFKRHVDDFVQHIKETLKPKTVIGVRDDLYLYKDGYYHPFGDSILGQICNDEFKDVNKPQLYKEILHKVISLNKIGRDEFIEAKNRINLENGVLNVYTREIMDHNPDYNFLYRIERKYDSNELKDCPEIKRFLNEICEGDQNKYWLIIEFFGYMLVSDYKIKKFLCIFGDGDNGKSTLANLMTEFINKKNVSGLSLRQLTEKDFLASNLYGMKLNIKGESMPTKIRSLEIMKSLTGGDEQYADRKFKDPLKFVNTAKFVFHFNELPEIDLMRIDEASLNRIILLHLKHNFVGNEDDKNLFSKLTTKEELEGLLHLALEGLERLRKNKKFTYDDEMTYNIWKENQTDFFNEFIEKYCLIDSSFVVPRKLMLEKYNIVNKNKQISMKMLTHNMLRHDIRVEQRGKAGHQERCYIGIKLKKEEDIPKEKLVNDIYYECPQCSNNIKYPESICKSCDYIINETYKCHKCNDGTLKYPEITCPLCKVKVLEKWEL